MGEGEDKREHSAKPEVDDLTDYQSLNSLGGAGVAGEAEETQTSTTGADKSAIDPSTNKPATGVEDGDKFNDAADFFTVDNKGLTNS